MESLKERRLRRVRDQREADYKQATLEELRRIRKVLETQYGRPDK